MTWPSERYFHSLCVYNRRVVLWGGIGGGSEEKGGRNLQDMWLCGHGKGSCDVCDVRCMMVYLDV